MTEDEYLAFDRVSDQRWEYVGDEVFECSGGSARPEHNLVVANVTRALGQALLDRPCGVLGSQQKVATRATGAYHYPDIVVVCSPIERHPKDENVVTNPKLIVEVLSPTTADYDRGAKFEHYVTLPSLDEVILVSLGPRFVQRRRRHSSGDWVMSWHHDGQVELASIGCAIAIDEVFAKLDLAR